MISLAFIIERGYALRRNSIIPEPLTDSLEHCQTRSDVNTLLRFCQQHEHTPLSRLTSAAIEHLEWAKPDNVEALQTRARHEVSRMERGLVVLEIITGIAPLLGLVGTVFGLIEIFGEMTSDQVDTARFASGHLARPLRDPLGPEHRHPLARRVEHLQQTNRDIRHRDGDAARQVPSPTVPGQAR